MDSMSLAPQLREARRNVLGIPLVLRWTGTDGSQPLPQRVIRHRRGVAPVRLPELYNGNGYHGNGQMSAPFDFSWHIKRLCADVSSRCEVFHQIDVRRILFSVTQARAPRRHGLQAKVIPLRFRDGQLVRRRRDRLHQVQRYRVADVEMLYVMAFCLPRFLDQSFDEKFITIFHELYHIAPEFNGDLRRHGGRCDIHTRCKKTYDRHMAGLVRDYLRSGADPALHAFLRLNFHQLEARHGVLFGLHVPVPKLVPLLD
jgi:hypothetical protein